MHATLLQGLQQKSLKLAAPKPTPYEQYKCLGRPCARTRPRCSPSRPCCPGGGVSQGAAARVCSQAYAQDCIRDLIADILRMTLVDGLQGGETTLVLLPDHAEGVCFLPPRPSGADEEAMAAATAPTKGKASNCRGGLVAACASPVQCRKRCGAPSKMQKRAP